MEYERERKLICEIGRRMYERGMAAANDGNISLRLDDGRVLCTPTGVSKGYMSPEDMCVLDMSGKEADNNACRPSSEIKLHLAVYRELSDINAVVHAHPVYATTFAAMGRDLTEPILIESVEQFGIVKCVPYAAPSTDELARSVLPYLKGSRALLLEFHGALTYAGTLTRAYMKMESLEFYSRVLYQTMLLKNDNSLDDDRVRELLRIKERLKIE